MKISVFTLGCKVNQYESREMVGRLIQNGYDASEGLEEADVYIINTCSVTAEADRKSRQAAARALSVNKDAKIYITGCSSENDASAFLNKKNVRMIGGTGGKAGFIDRIIEDLKESGGGTGIFKQELPLSYEESYAGLDGFKTRGSLKIQDGCDNFCSYCIVPYLRGRARSRGIKEILKEAEVISETSGELVLTGINISSYGKDTGSTLLELIRELKHIRARKRFGSLECGVITKEFIETALDSGFCNHFHLSMQSGSTSVLKMMNRKYTKDEFLDKVRLIKDTDALSGITTDIIAGFPMETENEHKETLETMHKAEFSNAHIFPYSKREGTPAAGMPQVPKEVRLRRAAELTAARDALKTKFLEKALGCAAEVYIEESADGLLSGYTRNYIKVYLKPGDGSLKSMRGVKLISLFKDGMAGEAAK